MWGYYKLDSIEKPENIPWGDLIYTTILGYGMRITEFCRVDFNGKFTNMVFIGSHCL